MAICKTNTNLTISICICDLIANINLHITPYVNAINVMFLNNLNHFAANKMYYIITWRVC